MTRPRLFLAALLTVGLTVAPALAAEPAATEQEATLEAQLIRSYQGWRASMLEADYPAWQKHTASYRRAVTRNNIVSQKLKFPDALFSLPMQPASVDGLTPIQARAVGRTGQLVYFGKIDVGLDLPEGTELPDSLLILKFIKDSKVWKFNTLSLLNLGGADELKAQIAKRDYSFLDVGNFVPPGFVPLVPQHCPVPEFVGQIQITSFGYETVVTINGISVHEVSDTATSELIIGGLKNTPNSVSITSKPLKLAAGDEADDEEIPRKLEVTVYALPDREGERVHTSWHYAPKVVVPSYRGMFFAMPR